MKFDITWTITAIIAVSSFLSPILVAIINNHHQRKMRKMELEYDTTMKKLTIIYEDKKKAYSDFLIRGAIICTDEQIRDEELGFYSHAQIASLFASVENQKLISNFTSDAMQYLDTKLPPEKYDEFKNKLSTITASLNEELVALQNDICTRKRK